MLYEVITESEQGKTEVDRERHTHHPKRYAQCGPEYFPGTSVHLITHERCGAPLGRVVNDSREELGPSAARSRAVEGPNDP